MIPDLVEGSGVRSGHLVAIPIRKQLKAGYVA